MTIIDFHIHTPIEWIRDGIPPKFAAEKILQFMDESGVDVGLSIEEKELILSTAETCVAFFGNIVSCITGLPPSIV
ncbi:MAG: hypothetical protein DRO12_04690 [Thermoprotei archaeon]|nr:MAG: hypothetical protein DRO12_04690 [Thermoprotei archaeon]